jgi:hypothetical protein
MILKKRYITTKKKKSLTIKFLDQIVTMNKKK